MSEHTPSHAASHRRLRRLKQAIVLGVAGGTAAAWALVATNTVGVTAGTASAGARTNSNTIDTQPVAPQGGFQGDDGFFGAPNDQPGFFGGGSRRGGTFGGNSGGTFGGTFGGNAGGSLGGGFGPMMRSGGS
jgi:hypothetical protein